jgi:hypothetical protein
MALFNNQIIFNLLITLVVGAALYYYIKYKCRVLELTQREHAKVLQSVIMSMNNPRCQVRNINDISAGGGVCSLDELPDINQDIERYKQVNNSELIDVSDDGDDSDDDDSDSDSGSDSDGDRGSESDDEESYNTKRIIIGGNIESQTIEHLTGPDVKVIELSHPLYPSHKEDGVDNEDEGDSEADNDDDDDDEDDDDDDDDDENNRDNDDDSSDNNNTNNIGSLDEVTRIVNSVEYLENLETTDHKLNTSDDNGNLETGEISIKTIFKSNVSDTHQDFNGMNAQSLRQQYKQRLLIEGKNMSEAAINKLTKKELIKNLQQ